MRAATALTSGKTPIDWQLLYLNSLSQMRSADNDFAGAIAALQEEQQLAQKNNRLDNSVSANISMSNLYQQHDMLDKATDVLVEALKWEEAAGTQANLTQMCDVLQMLGQLNERRGQPAKARDYLMRKLEVLPKIPPADSNQRYTDTYSLLGAVEGQLGNHTAQEKDFREGLAHVEKIEDKKSTTQFLIYFGNYLTGGGATEEGSRCYDRALQLVQGHNEKDWSHPAVITYRTCGFNNCTRGNLTRGIEQLQKALSLARQESDDQKIASPVIVEDLYWSSVYLAFGLSLDGRLNQSQTGYEAARELIDNKRILDPQWQYDYYWRRAIAYYFQGNTTKANELRQRAAKLNPRKAPEVLGQLRSHILQTASFFGAPMPDVGNKAIFSSTLDVLKARDRKLGHNSYFAAFGYIWMAWSFDNAGLSKEGDHLQSIADSIVKDLKPAAEHE
jgi:tetratricopeptide (TPR) repeat protein